MPRDQRRLARLYRRHGPAIYARCRRILRDDAAAEDATQETFLRVFRHLEKAPDDREALTWIYRIATNQCLNVLRDAQRRTRDPDPLPDPAHPESALADRNFVAHALRHTPRKVSAVVWLHHIDGLAQGDVAAILGISRRTVVNRLSQFAQSLRRLAGRR